MSSLSNPNPPGHGAVGVLVVDDQPVFRRVARAVIDATAGFEPLGDATSGAGALVSANQLRPDLVLMDVQMPGMDGFEATRRLIEANPKSVVVLISLDDMENVEHFASCGASAFLRKQDSADASPPVEDLRGQVVHKPRTGCRTL
jgi:two-component system, NarL family, invasion response regulator UvrY